MGNEGKIKIGIIGYGNMGSAIAERIKSAYAVSIFDKDKAKTIDPANINVADTVVNLAKNSDVVILAVKPQDFDNLLQEIKKAADNKLIISIAAGISTIYIEKILAGARVIRAMPNIAAKIGEAESVLCKGNGADDKDFDLARNIFNYIGKTWKMEEKMLNAATAISGSGPAYIYHDMENKHLEARTLPELVKQEYVKRLREAAERVGFDVDTAQQLASATTASSISLSAQSGISAAELKRQVMSPRGTTEAAIKKLEEGASWADAAVAAKKRAEELSRNQ